MKINFLKSIKKILFSILIVSVFTACEDFEFPVDLSFRRLFSPVVFQTGTVSATKAELIFSKVSSADLYLVELSEDSLQFSTIVRSIEFPVDSLNYAEGYTDRYSVTISDLLSGVRYSARLKAVSSTGEIPDSKWVTVTFVTKTEQIFTSISSDEITDNSVVLHWNAGESEVTKIILVSALDGSQISVDLTVEDKINSWKKIEGLAGGTTYMAYIYNNDHVRGTIAFRTYDSVPTEGVVIRLDGGEDIYTVLQQQSGDITLVLPASSVYVSSWFDSSTSATSYSLPLNDNITSLTIWGLEGGEKAKLNCTSVKLGAGTRKIFFRNIEYVGNSSSSDYVINESATRPLSEVTFENCVVHNVRGVFRLQNDANYTAVDKISFTDCVIYDINGYGLTNTSAANVKLMNLEIKECTFYNMTDALGNFKNSANSVVVDACTFYNCFANGKYIFNFNSTFIPSSFVIRNCIFGKFNSTVFDGTQSMRATNPKITTSFMENTYKTSDCIVHTGYPMTGVIEYLNSSADLFVDPENHDFKIKDASFEGYSTAGDPRWR
jgi:hypothetical protein